MASWQAHFISFVLRHTFKKRLAKTRTVKQARRVMSGNIYIGPRNVRYTQMALGTVPCESVESGARKAAGTLFYLHGGGYFACSPRTHRPYTSFFAQHGFRVFAPRYRLAPEHPFPAPVQDAVEAYRALRAQAGPKAPIAIAGDSAGGGLALAALLKLRDDGDILPSAAALFSPLTDLMGTGASCEKNSERCAMFYCDSLKRAREFYVPQGDPRDPLASPLYGNLKGLPPLLIHVGADETLLDDSTRLAERARAAGVPVDLKIWPVVSHDWHLFYQFVPEGRESLAIAAQFLMQASNSGSEGDS